LPVVGGLGYSYPVCRAGVVARADTSAQQKAQSIDPPTRFDIGLHRR
jgi:hypothetical protein